MYGRKQRVSQKHVLDRRSPHVKRNTHKAKPVDKIEPGFYIHDCDDILYLCPAFCLALNCLSIKSDVSHAAVDLSIYLGGFSACHMDLYAYGT